MNIIQPNIQTIRNLQVKQINSMHFASTSTLTDSNQIINIDYQKQLFKKGFSFDWLYNLYLIKSQQQKLKTSQVKYKSFVRQFYNKMIFTKSLNFFSFNYGKKTSEIFLDKFSKWNKQFIFVDLSQCLQVEFKNIINLIKNNKRMIKIKLSNMRLDNNSIKQIFKSIIQTETIYQLDLSNINSQNMNSISQDYKILYEFTKKNTSVGILTLNNCNLQKVGLQALLKGIQQNPIKNTLKVLNVSRNSIEYNAFDIVTSLSQIGITHLDISENPLSPQFFYSLRSWETVTLKSINLANTGLDSQSFCTFLSKVQQNKSLESLKIDKNDFSHHSFSQVKNKLETNSSIQSISLVECNIKYLSAFFEGLTYNRYIKNVNISYNDEFQKQDSLFKKVYQCIKSNKCLEELKMRRCRLNSKHFQKIFESITFNQNLKLIDISENSLSEEGAKTILKALNQTDSLENVIMQKIQISIKIQKQINDCIKNKKQLKQTQNLTIRLKDQCNLKQLEQFETQIKVRQIKIAQLEYKVKNATKILERKKQKLIKFVNQKKQEQIILDSKLKTLNRKKNNQIDKFQQKLKIIQKKANQIAQEQQIQKRLIQFLQQKIKKQNDKNKDEQNKLQDCQKKKKQIKINKKKTDIIHKRPFDNTSSLIKKKVNEKIK